MPKPRTSRSGLLLAMLLALSGCASVQPVATECPKFVPSPEALRSDAGDRLEVSRAEADRVLHDAVAALERADEVAATLEICQSELRQCAGLR
jgi:hypothetical protein